MTSPEQEHREDFEDAKWVYAVERIGPQEAQAMNKTADRNAIDWIEFKAVP